MEQLVVNFGIVAAYFLIGLGIVLAVVFPLVQSISNPKALLRAAIGVVIILVVFGIGYALSDGGLNAKYLQSGVDTETLSQAIGGMLKMVYLMMGIAAVAIIYTEFSKAVK